MTISIDDSSEALSNRSFWAFLAHSLRFATIGRFLDGDPLVLDENAPAPVILGRIRAEQLNNVARNTPVMMLATCLNALMFPVVMAQTPRGLEAGIWAAAIIGVSLFMYVRCKRAVGPKKTASLRGIRLAAAYGLLHGSLWGLLPALFFIGVGQAQQLIVVCLCIGMLCGGAFTLSPIPVAAVAFVAPIVAGSSMAIKLIGEPVYGVVAGLMIVYTTVLLVAAMSHAASSARQCVAAAKAEEGALTDELTKLPNHTAFREELRRALARQRRLQENFALLCFDLDDFKTINDTMGYIAGDQMLIETARRLKQVSRDSDMVARLGYDKFALIAVGVATDDQAKAIANRIVGLFRDSFEIAGHERSVTISVGVALAPIDGDDVDLLLRNADSALYSMKRSGKNGYTMFRDENAFVPQRGMLEAEIKRAITERELFLVFQPCVQSATLRTTGFEALLRWKHPARGVINAGQIVPLLEYSGLIDAVGAWVMGEAIAIAATWPQHLRLAVNVSPQQLRNSTLEKAIFAAIVTHDFDPRRLELELTESSKIMDSATATLSSFRGLGIKIALDDLGTGYSSLSSLLEFPFDRLKIDQSFVMGLETNSMCAAVVKISIELARALKLDVTAEGIENTRQLDFLRSVGCDDLQGYLFSEPRPADEIASMFFSCPEPKWS
jgi:diguanylate cyclase (GGDEF)-like protein